MKGIKMEEKQGYLVLTRKIDGIVMIEDIQLTVVGIDRGKFALAHIHVSGDKRHKPFEAKMRTGDEIAVPHNTLVKVLGIFGQYVRFGFSAPPSVMVHRKEIYDRIHNEVRYERKV